MADEKSAPPSQLIVAGEREWQSMSPTLKSKLLWSDPATKRQLRLSRFEPGAKLPIHRHVGDELVYVIEGAISDEFGTVRAGDLGYRPDQCVHTVSSGNGATIIALLTGAAEPATELGNGPRSQVFVPSEIPWKDVAPGMKRKALWSDEASKRRADLMRFEPGVQIPLHRHLGDELIFLLEGSNADEWAEVLTGNISYRPNGCTHTVTSRNGATLLAFISGGAEMVKQA
ncbi:MAG TPA: cupin domain-containing protein [Candidatus Binataceae bacterium]|jgi:anti-sigma factor ChrR (cupin superfamily)|nr:cupin domain-containing protein [Candidatus Binataceae bacterium]